MADGSSLFGLSQRQPPANLEAEQALLGALLANNKAFDRVSAFLRPEHFADAVHGRIYEAIARRIEAGQLADAVTLRAEFEHNGLLDDAGGVGYLAQLLTAMVSIINAGEYGRAIEDCWLRRQLIDAGEGLVNLSFGAEPELSARDILARADEQLLGLGGEATATGARTGSQVAGAIIDSVMATRSRAGGLPGVTTGLRGLDRMTGGLRGGQFVLVAGRPSMGKTSMALKMTIGAARAGARVLFVSAEMLSHDVLARTAVAEAGLPLTAYTHAAVETDAGRLRALNDAELQRLSDAAISLGALPITWDDESVTVQAIRARARAMMRAKGGGLDLIVIDYLGRLRASQDVQRFGLNSIVTELSKGLKDLAKQLGVPVVVLSQLSREVERREDKTPLLSDLRDSGSLEQDADVVIFLYREHYYLIRSKPTKGAREKSADYDERINEWEQRVLASQGHATAIVAKQRQGRIGPVRLRFDDATAQYHDDGPEEGGGD